MFGTRFAGARSHETRSLWRRTALAVMLGAGALTQTSFADAQSWSAPVELSSGTLRSSPQLAVDSAGDAIAAWQAYDGSASASDTDRTAIDASILAAGGAFAQPETLEAQGADAAPDSNLGGGDTPTVGLADGGTATLMWRRIGAGSPFFSTRTLTTDWDAPARVVADGGSVTGQVFVTPDDHRAADIGGCVTTSLGDTTSCRSPSEGVAGAVDVLSDGSALVATPTSGGGSQSIVVQTLPAASTSGSTFSDPVTVTSSATDSFSNLQLRVSSNGDAVLAFTDYDPSSGGTTLEVTRSHGGTWSSPQTISTAPLYPYSLAVDRASGMAMIAYSEGGTAGDEVLAAVSSGATEPFSSPVTLDDNIDRSVGPSVDRPGRRRAGRVGGGGAPDPVQRRQRPGRRCDLGVGLRATSRSAVLPRPGAPLITARLPAPSPRTRSWASIVSISRSRSTRRRVAGAPPQAHIRSPAYRKAAPPSGQPLMLDGWRPAVE